MACGIALVLGYAGRWVAEFAFVLLSLLALTVPLPVAFDVWLPAGRGERWYATIAGAVVTTSLLTIAAAGIAVLSWVLALLAPDIPLDGISLPYVGMSLWSLCLPSLLVPWLFLLRLLGHRMPIITAARGYMVLVFLVAAMAYPELVVGALRELRDPIVFACMLLGGWVIFLVVLRHACMKWDLLQNRARVPGISGGYR